MRIGILGHGFIEWGGGLDFLRTVCGSLVATGEPIELHLLMPTLGPRLALYRRLVSLKRGVNRALGRQAHAPRWPDARIVAEFVQASGLPIEAHQIDLGSGAIATAGRRLGLSAVLPSVQPLRLDSALPWLGYIADFQHMHLPQYFSPQEVLARDRAFTAMLAQAPTVIVNAQAVVRDIRTFAPGCSARIVALPFAAAPNPDWLACNDPPLRRYGIDGPYFIVCNQFWQHKDHLTAFRAFAQVMQKRPDMMLVCTGEMSDYRNPEHFPMLRREAEGLGIDSRLRILGLIPKLDQIALLRCAQAVLQPTLSEGGPGGGAVYDAVALGVPAIASDIPVNLEIDEPGVRYFPAGDAKALALRMTDQLAATGAPRPQPAELLAAGKHRRKAAGEVILKAIDETRSRIRGPAGSAALARTNTTA